MTHTHSKIQLHYFWPGMSDFVRDRITACHKCIASKSPVNRHQPMGHVPVSGRFEHIAMDLLDVSVISAKGYKYILVVCDYFTKYTEALCGGCTDGYLVSQCSYIRIREKNSTTL